MNSRTVHHKKDCFFKDQYCRGCGTMGHMKGTEMCKSRKTMGNGRKLFIHGVDQEMAEGDIQAEFNKFG